MYIGIAGNLAPDKSLLEVGLSIHDATYSIDFSIKHLHFPNKEVDPDQIASFILETIMDFSKGMFPLLDSIHTSSNHCANFQKPPPRHLDSCLIRKLPLTRCSQYIPLIQFKMIAINHTNN